MLRHLTFLAAALLLLSGEAPPDPSITDLDASASATRVSVRFNLQGAFHNEDLLKAVQSGLPTGFTYYIELIRVRPNWFDETVARSQIEVVCTYNSLTREYLLNYRRDKRLVRSETLTDLKALQQHMTSVQENDLFDLDGHRPSKLAVRAKADIMRGYLLYLMPWELSTNWTQVRVQRQAPSP